MYFGCNQPKKITIFLSVGSFKHSPLKLYMILLSEILDVVILSVRYVQLCVPLILLSSYLVQSSCIHHKLSLCLSWLIFWVLTCWFWWALYYRIRVLWAAQIPRRINSFHSDVACAVLISRKGNIHVSQTPTMPLHTYRHLYMIVFHQSILNWLLSSDSPWSIWKLNSGSTDYDDALAKKPEFWA